jgi:hypothetical protein
MRSYRWVMSFLVVFFLPHSTLAFENEPKGFRAIEWWTHISKLPEMKLLDDKDNVRMYVREGDRLEIGEAKVEDIWYGFHRERFHKVTIPFISKHNYEALKKILFEAFGPGHPLGPEQVRFYWAGTRVNIDLNYDPQAEVGDLEIRAKGIFYYEPETKGSQKVESVGPGL